jgi:hypothetical protein
MSNWTQQEAIELCKKVESICPHFGCHVALTGGLLYKEGDRKDCDLLFYRIRQVEEIDKTGLFTALLAVGVIQYKGFGWCHKAVCVADGVPFNLAEAKNYRAIDMFFPEEDGGDPYPETDPNDKVCIPLDL